MVFDVGGTEIKYSIIDENLNMTDSGYTLTPNDTFEHFSKVIKDIYEPHNDEVEGIAMSLPGFVDSEKGIIKGGSNLKYNWGRHIRDELSKICNCKITVINDGKAAAIAELLKGSLKGCKNAAVLVLGTGLGGGIIINGELYKGIHETAGEFSFVNYDPHDFEDQDNFLAYRCSTRGLLYEYQKLKKSDHLIDGREFFESLDEDKDAQKVLDEFSRNIAIFIYNLFWILDLEKVAIGGGISRQNILIEKINEQFQKLIYNHPQIEYLPIKDLQIVKAEYANEANQVGAYLNYIDKM